MELKVKGERQRTEELKGQNWQSRKKSKMSPLPWWERVGVRVNATLFHGLTPHFPLSPPARGGKFDFLRSRQNWFFTLTFQPLAVYTNTCTKDAGVTDKELSRKILSRYILY